MKHGWGCPVSHGSDPKNCLCLDRPRKIHHLKTWPEHFRRIVDDQETRKTFELRKDDRPYGAGDVLHLLEWDPKTEQYTGFCASVRVTHLVRGIDAEQFGLKPGFALMSIILAKGPRLNPRGAQACMDCFIADRVDWSYQS